MQTRKQDYATSAFNQVKEIKDKPEAYNKKRYGSMAHKLPVLIRSAGLAVALEFVQSRGKDEHRDLLTHLGKTVLAGRNDNKSLLELSREAQLRDYTRLTRQCLEALLWYKRFAESVLDVKAGDDNDMPGGAD